jgi:hypothetical protein
MNTALHKITATRLSFLGIFLSGCAPVHIHPPCHNYCVAMKQPEYCHEVLPGYVLSQDKYDPNFVPCKPRPTQPKKSGDDSPDDGPKDDRDDEDDQVDEHELSSTGGGNGANAEQGNQSTQALAGSGAVATSGSVTSTANAGDLL